jgi:hypothetical protein
MMGLLTWIGIAAATTLLGLSNAATLHMDEAPNTPVDGKDSSMSRLGRVGEDADESESATRNVDLEGGDPSTLPHDGLLELGEAKPDSHVSSILEEITPLLKRLVQEALDRKLAEKQRLVNSSLAANGGNGSSSAAQKDDRNRRSVTRSKKAKLVAGSAAIKQRRKKRHGRATARNHQRKKRTHQRPKKHSRHPRTKLSTVTDILTYTAPHIIRHHQGAHEGKISRKARRKTHKKKKQKPERLAIAPCGMMPVTQQPAVQQPAVQQQPTQHHLTVGASKVGDTGMPKMPAKETSAVSPDSRRPLTNPAWVLGDSPILTKESGMNVSSPLVRNNYRGSSRKLRAAMRKRRSKKRVRGTSKKSGYKKLKGGRRKKVRGRAQRPRGKRAPHAATVAASKKEPTQWPSTDKSDESLKVPADKSDESLKVVADKSDESLKVAVPAEKGRDKEIQKRQEVTDVLPVRRRVGESDETPKAMSSSKAWQYRRLKNGLWKKISSKSQSPHDNLEDPIDVIAQKSKTKAKRKLNALPSDVVVVMRSIAEKRERMKKNPKMIRSPRKSERKKHKHNRIHKHKHKRIHAHLARKTSTAAGTDDGDEEADVAGVGQVQAKIAAAERQRDSEKVVPRKRRPKRRQQTKRNKNHRKSRRRHPFLKNVRRNMKKRKNMRKRHLQGGRTVTEASWKTGPPRQDEASVGALGGVGVRRQAEKVLGPGRGNDSPGSPQTPVLDLKDEQRLSPAIRELSGAGVRRQKGEGVAGSGDTIPTAPGCYVRQLRDEARCPMVPWTLDEWGKSKIDVDSWFSEKHCLARKARHDSFCGGDSSEWIFVEQPEPTEPGCYVKQPTNGMCKSFPHWTPDTWGKGDVDSWSSKDACLGRKDLHDLLCGGSSSMWLFVKGT